MGMPWVLPGGAGQYCWVEGCLGFLTQSDATVAWSCIKGDKWMDGMIVKEASKFLSWLGTVIFSKHYTNMSKTVHLLGTISVVH